MFCAQYVPLKNTKLLSNDDILEPHHWDQLANIHDQLESFDEATCMVEGHYNKSGRSLPDSWLASPAVGPGKAPFQWALLRYWHAWIPVVLLDWRLLEGIWIGLDLDGVDPWPQKYGLDWSHWPGAPGAPMVIPFPEMAIPDLEVMMSHTSEKREMRTRYSRSPAWWYFRRFIVNILVENALCAFIDVISSTVTAACCLQRLTIVQLLSCCHHVLNDHKLLWFFQFWQSETTRLW